jgi:hypothetical protein
MECRVSDSMKVQVLSCVSPVSKMQARGLSGVWLVGMLWWVVGARIGWNQCIIVS